MDFRHEVVLASVGAGGGCSNFGIESVERVGSRRVVEVLVEHTDLDIVGTLCGCTADFFWQTSAVVVARPFGDAEFVHDFVLLDCPFGAEL